MKQLNVPTAFTSWINKKGGGMNGGANCEKVDTAGEAMFHNVLNCASVDGSNLKVGSYTYVFPLDTYVFDAELLITLIIAVLSWHVVEINKSNKEKTEIEVHINGKIDAVLKEYARSIPGNRNLTYKQ